MVPAAVTGPDDIRASPGSECDRGGPESPVGRDANLLTCRAAHRRRWARAGRSRTTRRPHMSDTPASRPAESPAAVGAGHRLVFVGGMHRSGTTPLTRAIAAHPDVSGFENTHAEEDEGQHLQDVMPTGEQFGGPGRFALDPRSALTESSPLAGAESAARLMEQWGRYWDLSKHVLIEKSPPNLIRMRFLQALFPDASFIVITRHPVIVSLSTKKWAPPPVVRERVRELVPGPRDDAGRLVAHPPAAPDHLRRPGRAPRRGARRRLVLPRPDGCPARRHGPGRTEFLVRGDVVGLAGFRQSAHQASDAAVARPVCGASCLVRVPRFDDLSSSHPPV